MKFDEFYYSFIKDTYPLIKTKFKDWKKKMDDFFSKWTQELSIIITGIIAGLVRGLDTYKGKDFIKRAEYFICGLIASCFFCWIFFEFAFYMTNSMKFSLACGGFASWQGAEWIKEVVDKFINARLNKDDNNDESEKDL